MKRYSPVAIAVAILAAFLLQQPVSSSFAAQTDLGVKTSTSPTASAPYVSGDVIPLVRGTAWDKIPATLFNPCSATTAGMVPTPPNDVTKVLSGLCTWVTPAGGGGITINSTSITSGTTGRLLYDNAGTVGEAVIGSGLSFVGGTLTAPGGGGWGVVGTSVITGGVSGRLLYDNSGLLGELVLGTGISTWLGSPSAANFAAAMAGAVTVPTGGTGVTSITTNALLKGNGASPFSASALSDDGTKISATEPVDLTTKPLEVEIANAGSTGTTLNKLAKMTGAPATAVIAAITDADGAIGIVNGGAGTTSNARIAVSGQANCVFDGATTAGDFVTISPTIAGDCRDIGSTRPSATQTIGRVLTTNGAGGTYAVLLDRNFTNSGVVTGAGVNNGTNTPATVTTSGITGATVNREVIGALGASITRTLPAIGSAGLASDATICYDDLAANVSVTRTLTILPNAADGINGGSVGVGVGPWTSLTENCFRVSGTHNWAQSDGVPTSNAPAGSVATSLGINGLGYDTLSTVMDSALGNTQGMFAVRGATVWAGAALPANHTVVTSTGTALGGVVPSTSGNVLTSNGTDWTSAAPTGGGGTTIVAPQGRLTLTSGTPVPTADIASTGVVFYDCYNGGKGVPYYNGSADALDSIASCQVSMTMPTSGAGVTNGGDIFDVFWEGNTNHNICVATNGSGGGWASDGTGTILSRGNGYSQLQNTRGYYTNTNSVSHCYNAGTDYCTAPCVANKLTYLGTIGTIAAGRTAMVFTPAMASGGAANVCLCVWNAYNRVDFASIVQDSGAPFQPSATSTWQSYNGSTNDRIYWVDGLAQTTLKSDFQSSVHLELVTVPIGAFIGVGIDSTSLNTAFVFGSSGGSAWDGTMSSHWGHIPMTGLHYAQAQQWIANNTSVQKLNATSIPSVLQLSGKF